MRCFKVTSISVIYSSVECSLDTVSRCCYDVAEPPNTWETLLKTYPTYCRRTLKPLVEVLSLRNFSLLIGFRRLSLQEVSIFMFEKKQIDRYSRRDKDIIIDTLKKGVSQLTRLRHPKILSVLHPLEESR